MDCSKVGTLILNLRREKNMTQKDIAAKLNISDKTISKWERGIGCPDVALLDELSTILGVNIDKILKGDLEENEVDKGNMKHIKFYVCKNCNNILSSTSNADIYCCGRRLDSLISNKNDENHRVNIDEIEYEYYIIINHEMKKSHYVSFIAYVTYDKVLITKLYPEQDAELRIPRIQHGTLYVYCSEHGLFEKKI